MPVDSHKADSGIQ